MSGWIYIQDQACVRKLCRNVLKYFYLLTGKLYCNSGIPKYACPLIMGPLTRNLQIHFLPQF